MTLPVNCLDNRYCQLVDWLANEHKVLSQALRREPTDEEHRAHAHAFVDLVFDDQAKAGAAWTSAATKIVRFVPPVRPRDPWMN
jgi:aromatic ring-cleaving dioxygenase